MKQTSKQSLVWDLPLRFFHGLSVLCVVTAYLSAGDSRYLHIHLSAGYVLFCLLLFRFYWGFRGSYYARFVHFPLQFRPVWAYLRTKHQPEYLGHNPLGSWAVLLLLGLLLSVSVSGLIVLAGEERWGLLHGHVSASTGELFHRLHALFFQALQWMLLLHISAVLFETYGLKKPLIPAMWHGKKPTTKTQINVAPHSTIALGLIGFSFGVAVFHYYDRPNVAALPDNALWREYCSECHLAYPPSLLPAAAWQQLMQAELHFEESLDLEPDIAAEISQFLFANAAEQQHNESAWHIQKTTLAPMPLRITQTPYWRKQHQHIDKTFWQHPQVLTPANCAACHADAEQGWFQDSAMHLPSP